MEKPGKYLSKLSNGVFVHQDGRPDQAEAIPIAGFSYGIAVRRVFFAVSLLALVLAPLIYIGNYAGDSQVHLIYGENASHGNFFEFNPGEKSPGVTSPGYMLFIGALFKLSPDIAVPAIVKASNILFWYAFLVVFFLVAKRLLQSRIWAWAATLAAGLLPGSVYNATIGMENGIFAFVVFLWILVAVRSGWFDISTKEDKNLRSELILGSLLGLGCWIRPEGFIVAGIAVSFRTFGSLYSRQAVTATLFRSAVFLIPFLAVTGGLVYFHFSQTGHLIPTSGVSRILSSNIAADTLRIGQFFVSPKFAIRLAQYFPLTILWLVANWLLITGRGNLLGFRGPVGFLALLFWTLFILYSTILGSTHLARYIIFVIPALVLVAMIGAKWLWASWKPPLIPALPAGRAVVVVGFVLALGVIFSFETNLRLGLDSQASLWKSMTAPEERRAFSDELFNRLGQPADLPISIGLQEIQARYWLDERFVVRSLDGRVDPILLDHATRDGVDHIGYIEERDIRFLLATPNYNRDQDQWSLRQLTGLKPGQSVSHDGLTFTGLATDETTGGTATGAKSGQWRWFTGSDGVSVLQWYLEALIRVNPTE